MRYAIMLIFLLLRTFLPSAAGQVLWTDPAFPTANEPVTVYFNAAEGTGGLAGCNCDVYLHAGLITSNSASPSDWKYVFTQWGVANADWKMTPVPGQPDVYSYAVSPSIRARYNVTNPSEQILQMAFVFRNANGSLEGKDVGGTDIFHDVYPDNLALSAVIQSPSSTALFTNLGAVIPFQGIASQSADLRLYDNGVLIAESAGTQLNFAIPVSTGGVHLVEFQADNGTETASATFTYVVPAGVVTQALPPGADLGINYRSDTSVLFALYAPDKGNVFLLGDFNDWQFLDEYQLKRTPDGNTWWTEVSGLIPGQYYAFQYVVDGSIRIGDPYSELILDPANDGWIPEENFPDMPAYPLGKTSGIVSLFRTAAPDYPWTVPDFQRPPQQQLVIYEMLMRDFLHTRSYQTLVDTLDYLQRLGITAVEFMPVNEFDGNQSWGYNPTYHYALDKAYGTPEAFQAVVDACHARGMAVIVDVVFNHAHERNPLCMLYWDEANFRPAPDNPWLNPSPTHDFNVFFDFNHESPATRKYVAKTLRHWLTRYKVDGFRFDLSKGLTQNTNGPWDAGAYDAARIAILKEYADSIWAVSPDAYVTLEHFAANNEEKELTDYGMMTWSGFGPHNQYIEAAMGYPSNLSGISHKSRGWSNPHLIGYIESHDEERLVYKCLQYGNASGSYDTRNLYTALDRTELANVFFYTVPGPKMLWQFGELGYDYSINWCTNGTVNGCRLDPKPIRWDYRGNPERLAVYEVIRSLLHLRNNYPTFHTNNFVMNVSGFQKTIHLNHPEMNAVVLGNFGMQEASVTPNFQHTGEWYEYFTGQSLSVGTTNAPLPLAAGEYRLYTDQPVTPPTPYTGAAETRAMDGEWSVFPNPSANGAASVGFSLPKEASVRVLVLDTRGRTVRVLPPASLAPGTHRLELGAALPAGMYFVWLEVDGRRDVRKWLVAQP